MRGGTEIVVVVIGLVCACAPDGDSVGEDDVGPAPLPTLSFQVATNTRTLGGRLSIRAAP